MTDDDFGTINIRRGDRTREIEVLRQHYRHHREALTRMIADAPTEHLAGEYSRLVGEIDRSMLKLDELDGSGPVVAAVPPPMHDPAKVHGDPLREHTADIASHPLTANPQIDETTLPGVPMPDESEPRSKMPLMVLVAVLVLGFLGWLIWRASSDRPEATPIVEETTATEVDTTPVEPAAPAGLAIAPAAHDYGTIRKGTRATRQFEVANNTDEPMAIEVARSACRCLFYEHAPVIPPKAKEALTVTVDGGRGKAGELRETVRVTAKSDPSLATSFDVIATIR